MAPVHRPAGTSRARQEDEGRLPGPRPGRGPQEAARPGREAPKQPVLPQTGPRQAEPREPESKLSALETRVLAFEGRWWRASGAKTQAISDELDLTPERYYQHLARLIDHPEAAAQAPEVVRRLRTARDERRATR